MIDIRFNSEIKELFPNVKIGALSGRVCNSSENEDLWKEIKLISSNISTIHNFESIREIPSIKSGKQAYKLLGKDPNRYRISAEAMLRRIVKGNSLYQIHTLVDVLNLVSIKSGVTIGGFDIEDLVFPLRLGIGEDQEDFEAIGRGELNIHRLPVYRDQNGAIGSPTSDCTRTMLKESTRNFLMLITDFFDESFIQPVLDDLTKYLSKYAEGENFKQAIFL